VLGVFYRLMYVAYEKIYGQQQMLHYPLYQNSEQDLVQGQEYFTDHCVSLLPDPRGKRMLDVGCGNGLQTLYIHEKYGPQYLYGVDMNPMHVSIAREEKAKRTLDRIDFAVDNAQLLASIGDNSFDLAICIESSHHYPDKDAFLGQLKRVLRPGGQFVIADLVRKEDREPGRLEKKFFLCHWAPQRYREALARLDLAILREEDLTDRVRQAFRNTNHWFADTRSTDTGFAGARTRTSAPKRLGRFYGQFLTSLYRRQIDDLLQYFVIVGQKTQTADS
jgi:ubiquinone/menaquinone biosynthesis C-methylase UbiE